MRCEIPHRCVRRKYRIRRHSPFRLRNCWEGRSVRASSLLRQLAKGGCAARRLSWVTPGFSQSRRCKTTASEFFSLIQIKSERRSGLIKQNLPGGSSAVVPPDPMPNSEVKRRSADGSVGSPHARVGNCQASNKTKGSVERLGLSFYLLFVGERSPE